MPSKLRKSGLDVVGEIAWGTHFCHFYDTPQDLVDTSVPYLQAGLESDECCLWMIPNPVSEQDAWTALNRSIPTLDRHRADRSIEVILSQDWYLTAGKLDLDKVVRGWNDKLTDALERGYSGLRVIAGPLVMSGSDWSDFCEYERVLNESIANQLMTIVCAYSLSTSRAADVLDVARNHEFATARRKGQWEMVETPELKQAKAQIKSLNDELEQRVFERTRQLESVNKELKKQITGRKRAEKALLKNERQFQALFDEAAIGIAIFDPLRGPYETNRSLQHMFGYSRAEFAGMSSLQVIETLTHPDDLPLARVRFAELVAGRRPQYSAEERYQRKDGAVFWGSLTVSLVLDEEKLPIFGIVMLEDISERKRAEEGLRKAQAELAHVSRVMTMGEMAASIAHEVNQPLAAIFTNGNACLRWLARETPELEEARTAVERIITDSGHASEVIQRIRTLVKNTEPQKSWLEINDVISEVIALTQREVLRNGVVLRTELFGSLPTILGDRVQLQQVMLNLIMNGVEAMSFVEAKAPRELLITTRVSEPATILVEVRDSGIGLHLANSPRLFDAFFSTKENGMGMGLSISRSIIEAHGGRLWATPNTSRGATFQFTLPIECGRHGEVPAVPTAQARADS